MAIRWVSTPQSVANNEPSVLAIAETLIAMAISVWIAVRWQTYVHIAIGACVAPLLLMRTDHSCKLCGEFVVRFYGPFGRLIEAIDRKRGLWVRVSTPVLLVIFAIWVPAAFLLARIAAWAVTALGHPVAAVTAIPCNWRNATMVIDSTVSPEVVPSSRDTNMPGLNVQEVIHEMRGALSERSSLRGPMGWFVIAVITVFMTVPPFVYRWSLKSTAIIWFPLLWALRSVREAGISLQTYFSRYLRDPLTWIVLCTSLFCLVGLAAKVVFWNEWPGFVDWWNSTPLRQTLSLYVAPAELPRWQLAMGINSLIAIVMFFVAWHWLVRLDPAKPEAETWPRRIFRAGLFIRPIISGYTIACTLYITIRAASQWNLPPLGDKWFPWM